MHWSTQAGTSSSVRDPYPARGLILHRRPLSGLPPHSRGERRIKRRGIAAGTATGAALGTKSNAKAERKCQNFALVTTLFSGSASPQLRGSSRHSTLPSRFGVASEWPPLGLATALCASAWQRPGQNTLRALTRSTGLSWAMPCVWGGGGLSTWSAALHYCTRGRPWSSWQGNRHARIQTGGIPLRASCPAAC